MLTELHGQGKVGAWGRLSSRNASSQVVGGPAAGRTAGGGAVRAGCERVAASRPYDSLIAILPSSCGVVRQVS